MAPCEQSGQETAQMKTAPLHRREFMAAALASLLACAPGRPESAGAPAASGKKNVLFIAVDDLRPHLGCYGHNEVITPNMDRLAARGMVFERAYCQMAICMASRASLLSGYRPDKGEIFKNGPLYKHVPDALPLNQHFLNHGYETVTIGKIYHHKSDERRGWSREAFHAKGGWTGRGYLTPEAVALVREFDEKHPNASRKGMGPACECADVPDNAYEDGLAADRAVEELNRLQDRPFFLAVGFHKPHLPFNAPKKYWDLYREEDIRPADNPYAPKNAPKDALTDWGELRGYHGIPESGPLPDDLARRLIHAYRACVSYTDAQIGRVLDELDRLNLRENTIVVLWGDHGWKLGEHGMWCKHTNFELDTRSTLLVSAPGMKAPGARTRALTEFVDVYPTLCDLAGLDKPAHLEGASFAPLLDDPARTWKGAAYSQYPRGTIMGYSVRTERHRYTEWRRIGEKDVKARELYDHEKDPDENQNVAEEKENREIVERHSELLKRGFATIPR